jgi:hypothetical protein
MPAPGYQRDERSSGHQPHRQHIRLGAEVKIRSQVESETDVSVRPPSQFLPVQPHGRVRHGAIEFDAEVPALAALWNRERFPVPSRSKDGQRPGMRIQLGIERTFDRPIVRQAHLAPLGIVEVRTFGAFGRALEEPPVAVEVDAALAGDRDRRRRREGCANRRQPRQTESGDQNAAIL